ncbi:MAG: Hpt domain-containing protein [Vulcanimicrobiota bacterium]
MTVDEELMDLIPGFLENRRRNIMDIRNWLMENNFAEIQRVAHEMKGNGSMFGFEEISAIGKEMERAAKNNDRREIEKLSNQLDRYLSLVKVTPR